MNKSSNLRNLLDKKNNSRNFHENDDELILLEDEKFDDEKLEEIVKTLEQNNSLDAISHLDESELNELLLILPEKLRGIIKNYLKISKSGNIKTKLNPESSASKALTDNIMALLKKNLINSLIRKSEPKDLAKLFKNCNNEFKNIIIQNLALKAGEKSNMSLVLILQDRGNGEYSSKLSNILLGKNHYQKTVENSAHTDLYHYFPPKYQDLFLQKLFADKSKNSSVALCKIFENRPELRISISENLFSEARSDSSAQQISSSDIKFIYENSEAKTKDKIIDLISNNIKTLDPSYLEIYKVSDDIFKDKIENSLLSHENIKFSAGKTPIDIIENYFSKTSSEKKDEFLDSLLGSSYKKFDELIKAREGLGEDEISKMLDKRADSYVKSSNEESICFAINRCNEKVRGSIFDSVISNSCEKLPDILSKSKNLERDCEIVKNIIEQRIYDAATPFTQSISNAAINLERRGLIKLSQESRQQCKQNLFSTRAMELIDREAPKVSHKAQSHSLQRSI